ncbi:MAG: hypothetical protein HFG51_15225 [Lachnospiraceae bacterium]|nr:hypothetical protein [Lachnospiraceae bacterium]
MGMFLQNVLILDCDEMTAKAALKKVEQISDSSMLELVPNECRFQQFPKGISILLNDRCCGYDSLAQILSETTMKPVMLLYIYDDDFWGYCFCDKGKPLDVFTPMPDYFEEVSEKTRQEVSGDSSLIASYFKVDEEEIKNYLIIWDEEKMENFEEKAYPDDECGQCDSWQVVDFMRKLGFPYEWDS